MQNQSNNYKTYFSKIPFEEGFLYSLGPLRDMFPSVMEEKYFQFHDCIEIGVCLDGNGLFFIDDKAVPFKAGDVAIIMPRCAHIAMSTPQFQSRWKFIFVDVAILKSYLSLNNSNILYDRIDNLTSAIYSPQNGKTICDLIRLFFYEYKESDCKSTNTLAFLCAAIFQKLISVQSDYIADTIISTAVLPAISYIIKNYNKNIKIDELSKLCNFSTTYFRRIFKASTKLSPLDYIMNVRINMAKSLLFSSAMSILEISNEVGFESISSFNRQFQKIANHPPKYYRNK